MTVVRREDVTYEVRRPLADTLRHMSATVSEHRRWVTFLVVVRAWLLMAFFAAIGATFLIAEMFAVSAVGLGVATFAAYTGPVWMSRVGR